MWFREDVCVGGGMEGGRCTFFDVLLWGHGGREMHILTLKVFPKVKTCRVDIYSKSML